MGTGLPRSWPPPGPRNPRAPRCRWGLKAPVRALPSRAEPYGAGHCRAEPSPAGPRGEPRAVPIRAAVGARGRPSPGCCGAGAGLQRRDREPWMAGTPRLAWGSPGLSGRQSGAAGGDCPGWGPAAPWGAPGSRWCPWRACSPGQQGPSAWPGTNPTLSTFKIIIIICRSVFLKEEQNCPPVPCVPLSLPVHTRGCAGAATAPQLRARL